MLTSVICLCHNHESFIEASIRSVWAQEGANVELLVVDDGSSDGSKKKIKALQKEQPFQFIDIKNAIGNCAAFNQGFYASSGDFIIDLAGDDMLLPTRVREGLVTFESKKTIGVEFCNVQNITAEGEAVDCHFTPNDKVPEGDLYTTLIKKYLISPPGMMIKRQVLEELNGYDETLLFEDFDFWIRSSRNFRYGYTDQVLVKKRAVKNSLSSKQVLLKTSHQKTVLRVCQKIKKLNGIQIERNALRKRCLYEIKQCAKQRNWHLIVHFLRLL